MRLELEYDDIKSGYSVGRAAALAEWRFRKTQQEELKLVLRLLNRRWRLAHPENVRRHRRTNLASPEGRERNRARGRARYARMKKSPAKLEQSRARQQAWIAAHPEFRARQKALQKLNNARPEVAARRRELKHQYAAQKRIRDGSQV